MEALVSEWDAYYCRVMSKPTEADLHIFDTEHPETYSESFPRALGTEGVAVLIEEHCLEFNDLVAEVESHKGLYWSKDVLAWLGY
jgi:hypothetical protein